MPLLYQWAHSAWPVILYSKHNSQQNETTDTCSPPRACIEPSSNTNTSQQGEHSQLSSSSISLCPVTKTSGIFSNGVIPSISGGYQDLYMIWSFSESPFIPTQTVGEGQWDCLVGKSTCHHAWKPEFCPQNIHERTNCFHLSSGFHTRALACMHPYMYVYTCMATQNKFFNVEEAVQML